jgi:hypothetical protein
MVGDPNQLPATVISQEAVKHNCGQSLFEVRSIIFVCPVVAQLTLLVLLLLLLLLLDDDDNDNDDDDDNDNDNDDDGDDDGCCYILQRLIRVGHVKEIVISTRAGSATEWSPPPHVVVIDSLLKTPPRRLCGPSRCTSCFAVGRSRTTPAIFINRRYSET